MVKMFFVLIVVFGLLSFAGNGAADEYYKWEDAKGTIHFSDNPTSGFLHSQYKEKILIKDGSVQALKKISFGERQVPKDQLLIYYKSVGSGQTGTTRQQSVSTPTPRKRSQAISSSFTPFTKPQAGGGGGYSTGKGTCSYRKPIYRRPITRR
jgi:hypothetical protein